MERLDHYTSSTKVDRDIRPSSYLQCHSCGGNCTRMDNQISFIIDSEKKSVRLHLLDSAPIACMGKCKKSCLDDLYLVKSLGVIAALE